MKKCVKRILSIILSVLIFLVNGALPVYAEEEIVITDVDLPHDYTEFYSRVTVTDPVFYDTLTCTVNGEETTISGFTWVSSDYQADAAGTYTFTAVAPEGYTFASNLIPVITVKVGGKTIANHIGFLISQDTTGSGTATGLYGTSKPGVANAAKNRLYDATGLNDIWGADTSANVRLVGGVDYPTTSTVASGTASGDAYAAEPTELTSEIGVNGAAIHSMYGGSYGNIFKGTTDIYVTDGTLTDGVYAGSINGDFEGTTNIYISGTSDVPKLYLGSVYIADAVTKTGGPIVGKETVSYNGTVNVYIADDFSGEIDQIEVSAGDGDRIAANVYVSSDCAANVLDIVGIDDTNLYIDGTLISNYVSKVIYDGASAIEVEYGTAAADVAFDGALTIVYGGVEYTERDVAWVCENYSADVAGDYTFTPVLPSGYDSEYLPTLPTVTVCVKPAEMATIEAVAVPQTYTEFYSKVTVTDPVFYDTLTCTIDGAEVNVSGFTWESADYQAGTAGTYMFTAVAPQGYEFAEGVLPTITVKVKGKTIANHAGFLVSQNTSSDDVETGLYGISNPGVTDSAKNRLYDVTGFNDIWGADTSANVRLVGGVDYASTDTLKGIASGDAYAENPTLLTSEIGVSNTTIHSMYGGSFGNIYKGTSNIYIASGTITDGIYAGSANGDFEGITNIYLSGSGYIAKLYLGSIYSTDAVTKSGGSIVGKEDVSYNGTINVYIASDFTGQIGKIVIPEEENDDITVNVYVTTGSGFDIFNVTGCEGTDNIYIDGEHYSTYLSKVTYDGADFMVVSLGTDAEDIEFEGTLTVVYGGVEYPETDVEWVSEDYASDKVGVYTFTPAIPSEYESSNMPELPEVKVVVVEGIVIDSIDVGVALETRIPEGVEVLNTPAKTTATYTYDGEQHTQEISVSYDAENYKPEKGEYTLSLSAESVQAPFILTEAVAKTADITVEVADIAYGKSGDVFCFENATISVCAEERGNYTITDAAQLYTYAENVEVIYAMEISGENPGLIIESPLVYVESDITFRDIRGIAEAEVAKSLVTKIRTASPDQINVNGVSLGSYSETAVTETAASDGYYYGDEGVLYLNGIPAIIAMGEDGGTYAYRSYDMEKLTETDLTGWDVSAGSYGADSVVDSTNVRFESGTVNQLFAGGQGITQDAAMVLDGGTPAVATYGGAMENGTVLKATIVYESGNSGRKAYVGGHTGSVLGDVSKTYSDDEYAAEIWYFDFSVQRFRIGALGGTIYGNVKMERYRGHMLEVYVGGESLDEAIPSVTGNVEITMYSGIWEKELKLLETFYGNATLRLYEGIHRSEFIDYPLFYKYNSDEYMFEVEYFSYPDDFEFIEYENHREEIVDTSEDAGEFIIRFLETKVEDIAEKGTVKIRNYTGDSIYIVFPNGTNMLIDTGIQAGGHNIVQDLRELGVEHLDYFMITHQDADHYGALQEICDAVEVDTFIYQKYVDIAKQVMKDVIVSEGAEVMYVGIGDTLDIGEVHIDVIGPDEELLKVFTDSNRKSIAMVLTYEESKTFLGADSLTENEASWLVNEELVELLTDCTLMKLNHHGIYNANSPEFLLTVNAQKYVITQMREYGTQLGEAKAKLQALGVSLDDIYVTGRHGMIKAVLGKDGTVEMSTEYVQTLSNYADYSELEDVVAAVDESELSSEELALWNAALGRVKSNYLYEEQNVVDGLVAYLSDIVNAISDGGEPTTPTPTPAPGQGDDGTGSSAGTGTDSGTGSGTGTGTDSGTGTGTDSGTGSGTGTGTDSGTGSGTETGTDSGTGSGTGTGTDSGTGTGTDSGTGTGTDSGTGSSTTTGSANTSDQTPINGYFLSLVIASAALVVMLAGKRRCKM